MMGAFSKCCTGIRFGQDKSRYSTYNVLVTCSFKRGRYREIECETAARLETLKALETLETLETIETRDTRDTRDARDNRDTRDTIFLDKDARIVACKSTRRARADLNDL